jgi:DNA-directed RNA polymerase delta subunit
MSFILTSLQDKSIFFDAILEFKEIMKYGFEDMIKCKLLTLNYSEINWDSNVVNFYTNLGLDEKVFYIGPKEKFPEYYV